MRSPVVFRGALHLVVLVVLYGIHRIVSQTTHHDSRDRLNDILSTHSGNKVNPPEKNEETVLPTWAKDYLKWHSAQKSILNEHNYRDFRYYWVTCFRERRVCGGAADRLAHLPILIYLGNVSQRILIWDWEYPEPLDYFLTVPSDNITSIPGLNWTAPSWLVTKLKQDHKLADPLELPVAYPLMRAQEKRVRSRNDSLALLYHNLRWRNNHYMEAFIGGPDQLRSYYSTLWMHVFQPSTSLLSRLQKQPLFASQSPYHALQIRSKYRADTSQNISDDVMRILDKMIATLFDQGGENASYIPIYIASDSKDVLTEVQKYSSSLPIPIHFRDNALETEPWHLDRGSNFLRHDNTTSVLSESSHHLDTFVDLYMLSNANCVWYGTGSFGWFGSLLSRDMTCSHDYTL